MEIKFLQNVNTHFLLKKARCESDSQDALYLWLKMRTYYKNIKVNEKHFPYYIITL